MYKGDTIRFLNHARQSANAVCVKLPGGQRTGFPSDRHNIARSQFEGVKDNNLRQDPDLYRAVRDNSRKRGGARLLTHERKALLLNYVGQLLDFALGSTSKDRAVHFHEPPASQQEDLVQLLRQAYTNAQLSKEESIRELRSKRSNQVYHQNHRSKSGQDGNKRDKRAQKAAAASKPVQEESWEMDDGVTPPPESEENENKDADDMKLDDVQQMQMPERAKKLMVLTTTTTTMMMGLVWILKK